MTEEQRLARNNKQRLYDATEAGQAAKKRWRKSLKHREYSLGRKYSLKGRYSSYKHAAKLREYSFELTLEQFKTFWQKPCHYCDDPIKTIGLDRIDNTKGYFMGNIVPCCWECNQSKWNKSPLEYVFHCAKVVLHYGKTHSWDKIFKDAPTLIEMDGVEKKEN